MPVRRKVVLWSVLTPVALIALLVVVILTFDWNRIKPWLNDRVSEAIGRPFAINGDLTVTWRRGEGEKGWRTLVPWPRLSARDITVGNPDWAAQPNMATVRELIFVLRPLPLLANEIAVPTIVIDSPAVWLERLADSRNNWTFDTGPKEGTSKWQLDVGEVVLARGNLALTDQLKKISLQAELDTIGNAPLYDKARDGALVEPQASAVPPGPPGSAAQAASAPRAGGPASAAPANGGDGRYGVRWKATGRYNEATINASGKAGTVLSLRNTDVPFPIQADVRVGTTRAQIEGTVTNPAHLAALDVHLTLAGDSMARLYALTGVVLPSTPPYQTRGRLMATLRKEGSIYEYQKFTGRVGGSDLSGTLTFTKRDPRPLLAGNLVSNQLRFVDLAPLIGADAKPGRPAKDSPVAQPADKALPVAPFRTERWDEIDADVHFTGKRIIRDAELPITDLVTHLKLQDGVLLLDPLNFGVAGGNLVSTVRLDGKREPMGAMVDLTARRMKLKQLFPTFDLMRASIGELNGSAKLSATGNSVAALLGSSNGEARLLVENGTVSKFLLEAIGLNVGSLVVSKLFGDKPVQINCGVSDFAMTDGVARARTFVLDTQDAVIETTGGIDLRSERLALTIHPDSKGLRIFSLRSPLYVGGTMKNPRVSPDIGVLALRAGGALSLALLAPVATAVLPLIDLSPGGEDTQCARLLAELRKRPTAPPPGKTYKDPKAAEAPAGGGAAATASRPAAPAATAARPGKPAAAPRDPPRPASPPQRPANDRSFYQGG
ncbi:putative outer membrane biogenesis protein, AsmA family [Cupriavidus taiwanensis LMG 19424]|uniref:Outer membrane biogenesis protein, AsmA family n=1 Tax=Cupriavidus taiwanensis (strain DSM 17343 / BCRC 17206 / CCUG 44338 / CIP 107171 / LMG 19424 / R1) TaxID=977880 RepID=B3R5Q6_CUPTR|nr:AsmA family protein [Cupriavidus taiwanensis]CAQ70224.1 putative outer membrane biogenesis protein, AsmA family [Cupriavidus taiwanensis LMG 19424]